MSVPNQVPFTAAVGNGVTTSFPFQFLTVQASDLVVSLNGVDLANGAGYSITGLGNTAGGSVTFSTAPSLGVAVLIRREIALLRTTDYQFQGDLESKTVNSDFDRLWQAMQGFGSRILGAIRAPYPEQPNPLPPALQRANKLLSFDSLGQPVAIAPSAGTATALAIALMASTGSAQIGHIAAGAGAYPTTLQEFARRKVWVADYLPPVDDLFALRDMNCAPFIQAAIDAACPIYGPGFQAGDVIFPDGVALRVDTVIDCTNSRRLDIPTRARDGLSLVGTGVILLGNTGPGKAIIEVTGSQFLKIDAGILLATQWTLSDLPNRSTLGIYSGVSQVLQQTQNQDIACRIWMHDDPSANGGLGTICKWNFGSEEITYRTLHWYGNVALVLTSSNDGTQPGGFTYDSYQAPLMTVHSLGVTTFSGECFLCGHRLRNSPLIIQNITGLKGDSLYISDVDPQSGAAVDAINVFGNTVAMDIKVTIEQYSSVMLNGSVINSDIDIVWGAVQAPARPAIVYNQASANILKNSRVKVALQDSGSNTRSILGPADGNFSGPCSYSFQNVEVIADALGAPNLFLPIGLAGNIGTVKVKLTGANLDMYQPSFAATYTGDTPAVTGDGTVYDLNGYAMAAQANSNNSLNTANGRFVAPQSGLYEFKGFLRLFGLTSAHINAELYVVANGIQYLIERTNLVPNLIGNTAFMKGSRKILMRANQEAFLRIVVSNGTRVVAIGGGAINGSLDSYFEGAAVH